MNEKNNIKKICDCESQYKRIYVRISNTTYKLIDNPTPDISQGWVGKQKRTYKPIGYICPVCKKIGLDSGMPILIGNYKNFKEN